MITINEYKSKVMPLYRNWWLVGENSKWFLKFHYDRHVSVYVPEKWNKMPLWAKIEFLISKTKCFQGDVITLVYSKGVHKISFFSDELDDVQLFYGGTESSYLYAIFKGFKFQLYDGKWSPYLGEIPERFKPVISQPPLSQTAKLFGISSAKSSPEVLATAITSSYGGKWGVNAFKLWEESKSSPVIEKIPCSSFPDGYYEQKFCYLEL